MIYVTLSMTRMLVVDGPFSETAAVLGVSTTTVIRVYRDWCKTRKYLALWVKQHWEKCNWCNQYVPVGWQHYPIILLRLRAKNRRKKKDLYSLLCFWDIQWCFCLWLNLLIWLLWWLNSNTKKKNPKRKNNNNNKNIYTPVYQPSTWFHTIFHLVICVPFAGGQFLNSG